jgi:choline dehydrogenase-like flavoprotein
LIANRLLSSKKKPSVLIIEPGERGDVDHIIQYGRYANGFYRKDLNYGYLTTPISALDGKVIPYSRGKGFGGCSMINCMVYTRGAVDDYAEWAKIVGSDEWAWRAVQQRFQKV